MGSKKSMLSAVPSEPNNDYEVNGHVEDLLRAHEIMNDPGKMKKVMKRLKHKKKAIKSIEDLKKYRQNKYGPGGEAETEQEAKSPDEENE